MSERGGRRLRLGMVGGGRGSFIGATHRIAARLDDRYELVAGALSSDPDRAKASAHELLIPRDRGYGSYEEMVQAEAERTDGIELVSVVTPNDSHHAICRAFLDRGFDVICDKPLTTNLEDALDLVATVRETGLIFGITYNYTGYPMVRHARTMVEQGQLGQIRLVQVEFASGWMSTLLEQTGHKQAAWRTDPARAGPSFAVGDIGTHAHHLAAFVTGLELAELSADLSVMVPGRRLDDNAHILLRYTNGARGMLWASTIAVGSEHGLRIRVYGDQGGLAWEQENPNHLKFSPLDGPTQTLGRGSEGLSAEAARATRVSLGHPEGFFEAFANLYSDMADAIVARRAGTPANSPALQLPTVEDGARGVKFVEAALESSAKNGAWVDATLPF